MRVGVNANPLINYIYEQKRKNPPKKYKKITISTIMYEVKLYAQAERADTLHLFLLYPYVYSLLCGHKYIQVYTKCQR